MEQLPFIERNFHIMNDDRFIMEKISLPIEIQDGEDIHAAINRTRETIVQNFKAAYPKVYVHLNFDEVRQVKESWISNEIKERAEQFHKQSVDIILSGNPTPEPENVTWVNHPNNIPIEEINEPEHWQKASEKTKKPTIEEQIEACTTLDELKSFKLVAEMNKKLLMLYHGKENLLTCEEMIEPKTQTT